MISWNIVCCLPEGGGQAGVLDEVHDKWFAKWEVGKCTFVMKFRDFLWEIWNHKKSCKTITWFTIYDPRFTTKFVEAGKKHFILSFLILPVMCPRSFTRNQTITTQSRPRYHEQTAHQEHKLWEGKRFNIIHCWGSRGPPAHCPGQHKVTSYTFVCLFSVSEKASIR